MINKRKSWKVENKLDKNGKESIKEKENKSKYKAMGGRDRE